MSHGTHVDESRHKHRWVKLHIWAWVLSQTLMNESCGTPMNGYEEVMSRLWMSHVTHMNESCHNMWMSHATHEWVMSHLRMSHGTLMNGSWHNYEWLRVSHMTLVNESWHTYEWVMAQHVNESCHTHMKESCRLNEGSAAPLSSMTHNVWQDSSISVIWLIQTRDMTHSNAWHDSFICMTHDPLSSVRHDETWPTLMNESCNMTQDSFLWMSHTYEWVLSLLLSHWWEWVMSHIWTSHVTRLNESCHTYEWVMSHMWMSHCHKFGLITSHIWEKSPIKETIFVCFQGAY